MIILAPNVDKIQVVTGSIGTIKVHASWADDLAGAVSPDRTNTAMISGAATTDVIGSPAASTYRNVKQLSIRNDHATTSNLIAVQHTDGTNIIPLWKGTLTAQEEVVFGDGGRPIVYDANGIRKTKMLANFAANALLLGGGAGAGPSALALGTPYQVPQINAAGTTNEYTNWPVDDQTIDAAETMTIPAGFSKIIAGALSNSGTLSISGRLVIM